MNPKQTKSSERMLLLFKNIYQRMVIDLNINSLIIVQAIKGIITHPRINNKSTTFFMMNKLNNINVNNKIERFYSLIKHSPLLFWLQLCLMSLVVYFHFSCFVISGSTTRGFLYSCLPNHHSIT